jgi:anti-sigma factor RsiW
MINEESKLKLQAHLDNELSGAELRKVAAWLDQDAEARVLYAKLHDVKSIVRGNELEVHLPESRDFYWSKIERAIRQAPVQPAPQSFLSGYPWWVRIFAPALGVAMLLVAGLTLVKLGTAPTTLSYLHEIETPLEDTSAISFHSQAAGMTVVWVQSQGN